jgi:predicted nucleic acid-binding protein
MQVAFDTNIIVYSISINDSLRAEKAGALRKAFGPSRTIVPTQVLGELYNVMVGKFRQDRAVAAQACELLKNSAILRAATEKTFEAALEIATVNGFQIWDALILATAAEAGCRVLLSEDMQHGFVHRGVTVINPFAEPMHPLLADALAHPR